MIENLLGNAVKYNRTGSEVSVEVRREGGKARILVQDDGTAVSEELRPVLFDPFVRGDRARQTSGGTGLGLAIAGKIVKKHGGKIWYERMEGENVFTVVLG